MAMTQTAPEPEELYDLVNKCTYRPGWRVWLEQRDRGQGSEGLTLIIQTNTIDAYHPGRKATVNHFFIVPAASYNRRSWQWWLFEQFQAVEKHECMEFFTVDGTKPYAPLHGPGNDPYMVQELASDLDRRTAYTGRVND